MNQRERILAALRSGPKLASELPISWWRRSSVYVLLGRMENEGVIEGRERPDGRRIYCLALPRAIVRQPRSTLKFTASLGAATAP